MYDQFHLPDLGEGLPEAEIVAWLVQPGEPVRLNQPIVEVETAKAAVEIPSPYTGVVHALHCAEGDVVPVGSPLLTVRVADAPSGGSQPAPAAPVPAPSPPPGSPAEPAPPPAGVPASAASASGGTAARGGTAVLDEAVPAPVVGRAPTPPAGGEVPRRRPRRTSPVPAPAPVSAPPGRARVLATPPVRRLARDLGVDLTQVRPTGPGGTIVRADVTAAAGRNGAAAGAPAAAAVGEPGAAGARPGERIPVRGVARQMALAMERSAFQIPQATVARTVDVTELMNLLARWRTESVPGADAAGGAAAARVTPLAFIARAVVAAIARHPLVNARWHSHPDGSAEIEVSGSVNLGIAVASERGLVVPVIPDADRLSLPALAAELAELVRAARAGQTTPARMRGATITVSNVGVFGVDAAAGLVREGEAALVVLGAIREAVMPWQGRPEIRQAITLSVSFDHRILDGEAAARFLGEVAAVLADPTRLLLLG